MRFFGKRTGIWIHPGIELENLVKSSSYWRERSLPWNSEGLRDSVDRFVGNYSGDKNIELAFVEISVGGITKCL